MTAVLARPSVAHLAPDPNPGPHLAIVPIDDVLDGESVDAIYYDCDTPRDILESKRDERYDALMERILSKGFQPGYGVAWNPVERLVRDGHHRLTVLHDLGARWCPVQERATHCRDLPGYGDDIDRHHDRIWRARQS